MRSVVCLLLLALAGQALATSASHSILSRVADSFVNKGYVRADPFELSPLQLKKAEHEQPLDADTAAADFAADVASASQPDEADAESLIENEAFVTPELVETDASSEMLASNERKGIFGAIGRGLKKGAKFVGKLFRKGKKAVKAIKNGINGVGPGGKAKAQRLEDCMACRFIWKQVEMDVANARYVEDVQASFEHNCLDAQKSAIFFKACEDMYDDMYAMTDDYMSQDYTVDAMCKRANMCKTKPNMKGQKGF